jgi:hypothetical protein
MPNFTYFSKKAILKITINSKPYIIAAFPYHHRSKTLTQMGGKNDILFSNECDKMPLFLNPFPITMTFRP